MDIHLRIAETIANSIEKISQAEKEGKQVALINYFVPPELCHAMDLIPIVPETYMGFFATVNPEKVIEAQEAAENYGIPRELCVFIKGPMGLALKNALPPIDVVCSATGVCMGSVKAHDFISRHLKCSDFLIDTPYYCDDESIKYVVNEYRECIKALEKYTGKKFDYDKLKKILEISERGAEYYRKINEFRKLTPSPLHNVEGMNLWVPQNFMSGTEDVTALYQSVYNEVKNRVEKAEKIVKEERHRILWITMPIFFSFDTLTWLEEKYGAVVVMEIVAHSTARIKMDPSKPLESLATKALLSGFASCANGPMDNLLTIQSIDAAKEYNVDAAILVAQWGCKQIAGILNMSKKFFQMNGIPTLILDTCIADERNYPESQIRIRLEEFFEMLEG